MWNDPFPRLHAALERVDEARRHLVTADQVPWTGPIAPRYRAEVEALVHDVTALHGDVAGLVGSALCRP